MFLIACGSTHQGHEQFILVMTLKEDKRFCCLPALLHEQFLPIHEWRSWCQDINQLLLHGDRFFFQYIVKC